MKNVSLVSLEALFANLIEEQTKTKMLANVSPDYVFRLIDAPIVPEDKFKPSRARICIIGAFLGFVFSLFAVFIHHFWKEKTISLF